MTTSIIGTPDPCGNISYQVFDYSTGSDQTVNSAIFSVDDSSPPTISLNNASSDLNDAGIYTFRFYAFYDDYEVETKVYQEFRVELLDPCVSATLSLD